MDEYWAAPTYARYAREEQDYWDDQWMRDAMYARELQCADEESLDQLMEELENEVVGEEGPDSEWPVWLEAGCRPVPNG